MDLKLPYAKDENLPTFEKVVAGFKKIDSLNIGEIDYEEIKNIFFENLGTVPQLIVPKGQLNIPIYRVRSINESKFDITKIETFSHPLSLECPNGRCNLKGFPVFYGSISADTALREMRTENKNKLKNGDEIYISHWQVKKGANFRHSHFIFGDDIELGEWIHDLNKLKSDNFKQISQSYSENRQEALKYINNKLSKYFVSDNYNISSFLGHYILYDARNSFPLKADAIMYPSIQAGLNNFNLAIHPDFVKNHLQLIQVQKVKFKQFEENASKLILLKTGIPNKQNKIDWFLNCFNPNDMRITGIEVMFENEPPILKLTDKAIFLKNDKTCPLDDIVWEYIHKNMSDVMNIISKINNIIDSKKRYKKDFFIHPESNNVYLALNNRKFFISTIKISMNYKMTLQKEN